jgi:hypothetical protein
MRQTEDIEGKMLMIIQTFSLSSTTGQKKFRRGDADDTEDQDLMLDHRPETMINMPIQKHSILAENQNLGRHSRILCDDKKFYW